MAEALRAEAFHDAWVSRGMTCAGTHAVGEALCQNVTSVLAHLASESPSPEGQYRPTHVRPEPVIDLDDIEMRFASQWGESDDGQQRAWRDDIAALIDEVHRLRRVSNGYFEEMVRRSESPSPEGLDVERLAEAVFRVGTGYRDRATATIAARIANSQDGARASREFAEVAAVEYARLAERRR